MAPFPDLPAADVEAWLARLRHDLVKRLVWPARDRRDAGGVAAPGELAPRLVDDEGRAITAQALWATLADDAPAGLDLNPFASALTRASTAAAGGDVDGVLSLEVAFDALAARARESARLLKGEKH